MRQGSPTLVALWTALFAPFVGAQRPYDKVCGQIAVLEKAAKAGNPSAVPVAIPIKATIDCIKNITVGSLRTYDVSLMLQNMDMYLDFETTLDSLKNPLADWPYPPHDLRAELEKVKSKVKNNEYANEYEFEVELFEKVFAPAHSGHLIFYPDLLVNPWYWSRNVSLVSISTDGSALPEIYFRDDILHSVPNASRLAQINGVDAQKFIEDLVFRAASQDPDAGYNAMFYNKAHVAAHISNGGYFAQGGRVNNIYPGEKTTYTFDNGTEVSVDNVALLRYPDFTGATDNGYFMNRYTGKGYTSQAQVKIPNADPGYPTAVVATKDGTLAGYYLDGEGVEDVAVLSVLSFSPASVKEYQAVAETFLTDAVHDGKTRLVVDLSANNGGYILSGYDLFRQLFPHTEQVGLTRFRNNKIQAAAIRVNAKIIPQLFDPQKGNLEEIRAYEKSWDYRHDLDQNGKNFTSAAQKFKNHTFAASNYSALITWDLNDPFLTTQGPVAFGTEITGYGSRTNFTQPFAAENMIMLTDGFCASTCFLFSDFMKNQAGVKAIAVGGLPNEKPMQAVGGVKGGELSTWADLYTAVYQDAFYLWQRYNMSDPDYQYIKDTWLDHREYIGYTPTAGVNLRDVIQEDHIDDGLAAQFVREDADCRLFYTKDMILDVSNVWKKAVDVTWEGGECVVGGLSKRDAVKDKGEGQKVVKTRANPSVGLKTKRVVVQEETVEKNAAWRIVHGQKAFE
ncbi:hypothetical protein BU23DRAFT_248765 [Bimuria novae-zelandiae CBS 107.79]|uniref:Uncharacterized protein n=1 Tax=Bimuria novae-zelandiae CBS 107.79 TaxID=1447943 RepID=A0A6A5V1Y6_9PLEO|nr:hypothetical protein BU23DRAFT_248765 [Bimuria novae-zelandiae CBS 107.79]